MKKERINELKIFFKIFTKYFRIMTALNAVFTLYLKDKIRHEDWTLHTSKLNEIDIDELNLMQLLYLDNENGKNFHILYTKLSSIMLNSYEVNNVKIKDEYFELLKIFTLTGMNYQKEIIELIKKEI
jgi:hypothetical protein